jgi:hypothetical protein
MKPVLMQTLPSRPAMQWSTIALLAGIVLLVVASFVSAAAEIACILWCRSDAYQY